MAMARAALADDLLGSLVRVPRGDWTTISQRVGYTSRLRAIAGTVAEHLPEFPALLVVCDAWRDTTFPAVVAASIQLGSYSKEAFEAFSGLLASTDRSGPLAPEVQDRVRRTIRDLAERTRALDAEFRGVATAVTAFYEVNRSVDTEVGAFVQRLGPSWGSILPATTAVGRATGLVRGAWEALSSDLDALGGDTIDVTAAFVTGLQIDSALLAWENLRSEADAFAETVSGQAQYLSGEWLAGEWLAGAAR